MTLAGPEVLASLLDAVTIGDYEVEVLRNEPSYVVQEAIEALFADGGPDDLLLLHVACHGAKGPDGEL